MIKLNEYIDRVGVDKVMHEEGGYGIHQTLVALSTLLFGFVGFFLANHLATAFVHLVSWIKEKYLDDKQDSPYDKKDVKFGIYGSLIALMLNDVVMIVYLIIKVWL